MEDCVFCRIAKGEIPCYKVYEDDFALAFLDIHPRAKGHTVVIPKKHATTPFDLDAKDAQNLFSAVMAAQSRIEEKLRPEGYNVGWNQNEAGGQVVPHLHIHILPRWNGDGGGNMHSIINAPDGDKDVEEVKKLL